MDYLCLWHLFFLHLLRNFIPFQSHRGLWYIRHMVQMGLYFFLKDVTISPRFGKRNKKLNLEIASYFLFSLLTNTFNRQYQSGFLMHIKPSGIQFLACLLLFLKNLKGVDILFHSFTVSFFISNEHTPQQWSSDLDHLQGTAHRS